MACFFVTIFNCCTFKVLLCRFDSILNEWLLLLLALVESGHLVINVRAGGTTVPLTRLRHTGRDPVSTQTLQKLDSRFRGNDEQAKLLLISFALQISETYDGAIASRRMPYIIWDSSG